MRGSGRRWTRLRLMLRGAIDAQSQVGLMLNVKRADLEAVLAVLPALNSPTISQLSDSEWVAVNTIVEERVARDVIPRLKAAGGDGHCGVSAEQGCAVSARENDEADPDKRTRSAGRGGDAGGAGTARRRGAGCGAARGEAHCGRCAQARRSRAARAMRRSSTGWRAEMRCA